MTYIPDLTGRWLHRKARLYVDRVMTDKFTSVEYERYQQGSCVYFEADIDRYLLDHRLLALPKPGEIWVAAGREFCGIQDVSVSKEVVRIQAEEDSQVLQMHEFLLKYRFHWAAIDRAKAVSTRTIWDKIDEDPV